MKKPKYTAELLKTILLWVGVMFVCTGILNFIDVLKPKKSSIIQEPTSLGIIFSVIGLFFVISSVILGAIIAKMNKLHSELLDSGTAIKGVVEKVYMQEYTQYGKQSPYRIKYVYTYQDKEYHHKSCFIWEKPDLRPGDSIMIYANEFGKSTILL